MLPGPVFTFEMLTASRRGRFYTIRALYATILLLILWTIHSSWTSAYEGEIPVRAMPWFGVSAFAGIALGQEVMVLCLTPALVAGAIADEKRRKTLHYLLASQLTGPEIVLGKLMVRMLYAVVVLGVSFPVMSLLVLLGGVDPMLVVVGCGALLSTSWFLATLSIWVSTIARKPRDALFIAFGLEALWLILPEMARQLPPSGWMPFDIAFATVAEWIRASTPLDPFMDLFRAMVMGMPGTGWEASLLWMIGLQAGYGAVLALLAAVQLRPIFRRQDGAVARPGGIRARLAARRLRRHPPIGDRPMQWKEWHTGGAKGFARVVGWLLTLIIGGLILYNGLWYALWAGLECREYGWSAEWNVWQNNQHRWEFYGFLKLVSPLVYLIGILGLAGSAAASITSEHEDDTWISLTATDLTGREIVLSKLTGALRRSGRLVMAILMSLVVGSVVGSVHWLSVPAMALALPVYGWFAAALGCWISIQLRSTWRAQFLTIAVLLLVNVAGQGILNTLSKHGFAPQVWPGFTPYEVAKLVLNPGYFEYLESSQWPRWWRIWDIDDGPGWLAVFSIASLVGYAALASLLTWDTVRRFDTVAGRARRAKALAEAPAEPNLPRFAQLPEPTGR